MSKRSIGIFFGVAIYLFAGIPLCWAQTKPPLTDEDKTKMVEEMFTSPYTEEMYYRTDELLLTATGSLLPVHKAPSVASIITSEDIENIGAITLDEVLETVPGLHVVPSNLTYLDSIYSIRGIHTDLNPQVLMLMNGVPFTMPYTGSRPATFRMPVANISRVEIIRGPGSAVHGADAFSGVINIITKDGFEIEGLRGGVRAGSFDTYDYWLQKGGNYAGWNMALSIEYMSSNGDKDRIIDSDGQSLLDSIFLSSASLAPGPLDTDYNIFDGHLHLAKNNWTIKFWSWIQNNAGLGAGATQTLANNSTTDNKQYLIDITYNKPNSFKELDLSAHLSYLYRHEDGTLELFPDGTILPIGTDGNIDFITPGNPVTFTDGLIGNPQKIDEQSSVEITGIYSGINKHKLRTSTGFKYIEEKTEEFKNFGPGVIDGLTTPIDGTLTDVTNTADIFMEDQNRRIFHVSAQDEWSFARSWELTAGVRYDHYSDFGETINPRAALVWETRYDLTTKLLYGSAFRAPSFSELYNKNNPALVGNINLEPEKIETLELAFDYQPTLRLRSLLNVFYYEVEDLIEIVFDLSSGLSTAQNAKDQNGYGFEIETEWEATNDLTLKANCAYQHSEDADTNETVANAPELQFYVNAHWKFIPQWSVDTQVFWIGNRNRATGDIRSDIEDYTLTNLTLRRKNIMEKWELALSVKNVFDEDIREPSSYDEPKNTVYIQNDYPMAGRSIYGEIKFHF